VRTKFDIYVFIIPETRRATTFDIYIFIIPETGRARTTRFWNNKNVDIKFSAHNPFPE
jgi:hypothetical protein